MLEDEHPVCYCVPDYHGALCELKYDDCESKFAQCDNGGTCIDGINSFTCSCPPSYGGLTCEYSISTMISVETEVISDQGMGPRETTTAVTSPEGRTLMVDTSVSLSSIPTTSLATYLTSPRTSTFAEKTTSTSAYADASSSSAEVDVSLTDVHTMVSTTNKDITRDGLITLQSVTISSSVTESYSYTTEIKSTEVYLPTGRSIHDGEVTKEPGEYGQTMKTTYPPISDRADGDVTRVTEYVTSTR